MQYVQELPRPVREIEHTVIPMSDGVRLAARIWMPEDAEERPVPAILEYIPYRKRDFTAIRDSEMQPYVAGHGYATVRVDMRGAGDSEGVLTDEYLEQEQEDGLQILEWLRHQSWCDGNLGIIGISWGGFNGLQIAALQPPGLKAIVTVCSTDDRYADDVHYMGGCLLGDNLSWASTMFAYNSCPPDPELVGDKWRDMWMERLENSGLWLESWLRHQHRDEYYKHGSVCEDFSAINCAVMAVSGWADGYSNAVFRLLEGLDTPRKGLIGPWSHKYPHTGVPGPAIGFLQEVVRWWDHFLKGRDTWVMDEPMLRVWMQDYIRPAAQYEDRPGRWVAEPQWPSENIKKRTMQMIPHCLLLEEEKVSNQHVSLRSPLTVGQFAGKWCSYSATPDLPYDQREEDGGSLVFETEALDSVIEILGMPELSVSFQSDQSVAQLVARLSDVGPEGRVTRVTYGLLNLTHRKSHEHPEALEAGKNYNAKLKLNGIAHAFRKGHKIRLSLSTSYWPLAWPPPEPVTLSLDLEDCCFHLPVRSPLPIDNKLDVYESPEGTNPLDYTVLEQGEANWQMIRNMATEGNLLEVIKNDGLKRLDDINLTFSNKVVEHYYSEKDEFNSVRGTTHYVRTFSRDKWDIKIESHTELESSSEAFMVHAWLDAYENGHRVFSKTYSPVIKRDLV
jgi:uncharacterized protein